MKSVKSLFSHFSSGWAWKARSFWWSWRPWTPWTCWTTWTDWTCWRAWQRGQGIASMQHVWIRFISATLGLSAVFLRQVKSVTMHRRCVMFTFALCLHHINIAPHWSRFIMQLICIQLRGHLVWWKLLTFDLVPLSDRAPLDRMDLPVEMVLLEIRWEASLGLIIQFLIPLLIFWKRSNQYCTIVA